MAEDRLRIWETLFQRALALIDSVAASGTVFEPWSFGGGTVLMRKYRHRFSKDIEAMTGDYVEENNSLKLIFPEGEIDFIASAPLTSNPTVPERLFGREVRIETSTEIIAKKLWHRGGQFKARDMFDLALVAEKEPGALVEIRPVLRDRRDAVLARMADSDKQLRSDFAELAMLEYRPTYDQCLAIVKKTLALK